MAEGSGPDALARALGAADRAAAHARRRWIRRQMRAYDRERDLSGLLTLPRHVSELPEPALTLAILVRLRRALRHSLALRARRRWTYSRRRHAALLAALGAELTHLREAAGTGEGA